MVYLGPDTQRTIFVASKFDVVNFLCAHNAVSKK